MPADPSYVQAQVGKVVDARITDEPLEPLIAAAKAQTMTAAMGALVTFDGIVRDHDEGNSVDWLDYSAHPQAADQLASIAAEVAADYPVRLWVAHRTGKLAIGESAFVVLAASAHRQAAFHAAETLAHRVKSEVPIWKHQQLADGTTQWVGIE
nr:molybdenum cofactor biosynthesis protein MoaE [Corynebacterium choanae]